MRVVFFGTPEFVLPVLQSVHKKLAEGTKSPIVAVVTQKPMPEGRKKLLKFSAIDTWAYKRKVPILFDPRDLLTKKIPVDIGILAAYGEIIPESVLKLFPLGILNIHPSLLPQFRGASPIQSTIASGAQMGATIIRLDSKMDHGPIITWFKEDNLESQTTPEVTQKLFEKSATVLADLLPAYIHGKIKPKAQDHALATYTKPMKKDDGFVPLKAIKLLMAGKVAEADFKVEFIKDFQMELTPQSFYRLFLATYPWPGIWTYVNLGASKLAQRLKILAVHLEEGKLVIDSVQLEGKNEVTWQQFLAAYKTAIDL